MFDGVIGCNFPELLVTELVTDSCLVVLHILSYFMTQYEYVCNVDISIVEEIVHKQC